MELGGTQNKSEWHFLSSSTNLQFTVLPPLLQCCPATEVSERLSLEVNEIWFVRCENEEPAWYGAVLFYGTLDSCPMGLSSFSSSGHILFPYISVHPPTTVNL